MMDDSNEDVSSNNYDRTDTDPNPILLSGLRDHMVGLDAVVSGERAGSLATLQEVFDNHRIIGLGEAAHGTQEFSELKHRFLRFFVEELGLRLFGLEANFTETLAINRYVRHGEGDPEAGLEGIYVWTWNTEEMLALVEWLRAFNLDRPPEDQVRFYGFDIQHTKGVADAVVDYLDRVDPEYLTSVSNDLDMLADPGLRLQKANGRECRLKRASHVVTDLQATLKNRRSDYVANSSEDAWELTCQHVTVLTQATEFGSAVHTADGRFDDEALRVRDKAMAENVEWILQHESAECIAVWAHNDHINRVKTTAGGYSVASMGKHFATWYGDEYYALGFEFGSGAFQAFVECEDENWNYKLEECSLEGPLPDTLASVFTELDKPIVFLDFRTLSEDSRLVTWLDGEHRLHSIGAAYDAEQPEKPVQSYQAREAFDGLCYVDETCQSNMLDHI